MKVWYCRNCGYEVGARGRCHLCKQRLVASHLEALAPGADEDEVGYRLDDWADRSRGRLIESLVAGDVEHRFEGDELVVATDDELRVDTMIEKISATAALDDLPLGAEPDAELLDEVDGEVDREVEAALRQLMRAATRLRSDPTDMEADGDVAEASAGVFMVDGWVGAGDDDWAAVGRVTRRLLAALGAEEALEEEIRTEAGVLARLLQPLLDDGAGAAAPAVPVVDHGPTEANGAATDAPAPAEAPAAGAATTATGTPAPTGAGTTAGVAGLSATGIGATADDVTREDRDGARAAAEALGLTWDEAPLDEVAGEESHSTGPVDGGGTEAGPVDGDGTEAGPVDADGTEAGAVDGGGTEAGAVDGGGTEAGAAGGLLGGVAETSYEAPEWLPDQRALLSVLLEDRGIAHTWDGTDLVVPSADEEQVEALFDRIGGVADDEDDEARYRAIEELFAVVVRLCADPDDEERAADVVRNSAAVEGPTPLGFDDGAWLGLRKRTRTLADALEHKAHPDVIASQATTLRDALRALV